MHENLEFLYVEEVSENNFGKFFFKPLDKGMGISIGNIFRRLLLTQITSTNIIAVRIPGINNEFSTIPGVREDVLEILLNLRQIILKGFLKEKTYARLKVQGPAIITANSINFDSIPDISLVNPTQYIATVFDTSIVEMEFKLESGKNYDLSTNKLTSASSDFITVERISSPIQRVLFEVDDTLSTQNQEELLLKVWTNGSITPLEAITHIAETIQKFFSEINKTKLKRITEENIDS
jgi:DNA-directed RNA polymerase subunit alpha